MANISFQLNTTTGFTTAAGAIANWGTGTVIDAWADTGGPDLANGETVYQNNDENPDAASGTLSVPFVGNATDFFAFRKQDNTIAAVQIDAAGLVSALTTTTTTTSSTTTTLPQFTCSDANVSIQPGAVGDPVSATVDEGIVDSITPNTYQLGSTTYVVDVEIPAGYYDEGNTIICSVNATGTTTTLAQAIAWANDTQYNAPAGASNSLRTFTITNNSTAFGVSNIVPNPNTVNWISTNVSSTVSGGSIDFVIAANPTANDRTQAFTLEHPENGTVTSTSLTIYQTGGNNLPVAPDFTRTMIENGTPITLNFASGSGWGVGAGQQSNVSDAEDSFGNGLTIEMISVPPNGNIQDANAQGTNLTAGAVLTGNSPSIIYTPNQDYTGTDTFSYKAVDSDGGESTGIITVTVSEPQNQPPVPGDDLYSINGYGSTSISIQKDLASAGSTDDNDNPALLTYTLCDNTGGPLTEAQVAASLLLGDFEVNQGVGAFTFTYTKKSSVNLTPNDSTQDEYFYYKVTDQNGATSSGVGTITLRVVAPGNNPPTFSNTTFNATLDQWSSTGGTASASDSNTGDTLTWSIVSGPTSANGTSNPGSLNLNPQTGEWQYEASYNVTQADTITFQIQVYDGYGYAATPYTAQINITPTAAILIKYSAFVTNSDEACSATRNNNGYLDATSGNTNIASLTPGDIIYLDAGFNTPLVASNLAARWLSVSPATGGDAKAIQLDTTTSGKIETIVECQVSLGNAWELIVNFDEDVNDLCAGTYGYGGQTVWQNVLNPGAGTVTLNDVVQAGGQIFTDEVIANTYLSNSAPAEFTALTGYYNDSASSGDNKYFEFQQGVWVEASEGYAQDCPELIKFQTYDVGVYYNAVDPIRIDNVCLADTGDLVFAKLYFRANQEDLVQNLSEGDKLLYILQHNLVPFTSLEAANQVDYTLSWPSTTFLASKVSNGNYSLDAARYFTVWENYNSSGYTGNYSWKGVVQNDTDLLQGSTGNASTADTITILGTCSTQFERPAGSLTFDIGTQLASRENVFYAFLSCVARFQDGSPYWNLYIVDGLHKDTDNGSSYIKELHEVIGDRGIINGPTVLECMSMQHKILAVNIEDAQDILNNISEYNNDSIRTVQVNPVDLGLSSAAVINYGYTDCGGCLMQTELPQTYTLATVDDADIINKSIPNFDLEKNYSLDDVSKPLLRTNPKLSTNAKLVVNSGGKMYIESIEATKELASVEYKKWAVNKDGEWAYDLQRFFKNTKTPADQIYKVKESYSNFAVQETFENQIEEDYHYGTVYNYSKIHDEDFRMMAPIWLDKTIPNKFVIFRVKDPIGTLDFDVQSNLDNIKEILKNSEIVKTFDLSRDSELGTYIRNHIQSESFPKTPITMNFDKLQRSSFNGIDLENGGFTSKGEYLDSDFISQDSTLIDANELITSGFQRNKLACANLINLEFLFNDDAATDYSVSRYFGLYVNDIDSGYGTLDSANTGRLKFKTINSYINNENSSAIPPYKLVSETPILGYAATSDKFYKISPKTVYNPGNLELNVEDSRNSIASEIKLAETGNSIDIKVDGKPGSDFVKVSILDNPAVNDGFAIFPSKEQTYRLKFTRLIPQQALGQESWKFTIVNPTDGQLLDFGPIYIDAGGIQGVANYIQARIGEEDQFTGNKLYPELYNNLNIEIESDRSIILSEKRATLKPLQPDFIPWQSNGVNNSIVRIEELQVPYDIDNNTFFALDIPAGQFGGVNFSNQGSIPQVTSAIVKSINSIDNGFTALSYDGADHFYIKTDVQGYRLLSAGIAIPNANANQWISVDSNNLDVNNLLRLDINDCNSPENCNTINNSSIYYFNGGNSTGKSILVTLDSASDINVNDYINTKSRGIYNKVIDIVDDIERLPLQYKKIVLEKPNTIDAGEIKTYADNLVKVGLFSAFDIHDMNFDFYDVSNSDLKELVYETPVNIAYEPEQDDSNDIYPFGSKENTEYTLDPIDYFSGLSDILLEEQADEFNENQITSEFDRLQENYLKEYAINSRVVPSINKWVLKDSLTVREQPYYLNANEAFGRSNFAPDLSADGRNRLGMTHEWFYINNLPTYFKNNIGSDANPVYRLNDSFSYINFMDNFEITPAIFKDTNYDYFDRFFVTEGFETRGNNNYKTFVKTDRQKKYTRVEGGNNTAFANTIFKGLKFIFKGRKEFVASNPVDFIKSSEFNGYRFSVLLNVKTAQESNGIEYEVIQNKKFKFVVFMISLSLDDLWSDNTLNRKLLYELNHSLVWKSENLTFEYSDIKIDGALNLQDANFTDPSASNYLEVNGFQHTDGSFPQFLEQINKDDDSKFGNLIVKIESPFGEMFLRLNIARLDGQDTLVLSQPPKDISDGDNGDGLDSNGIPLTPNANLQNIPAYLQTSAEYTYEKGGINAYKSILDALAARDVATMLLREPNNITFTTVNNDGQILNNQFVINVEDGTEIVKDSKVQTIPDTDKPESFKLFSGNIGYDLTDGFTYYPFLVRQNGGYTVDTKPVVTFTDVYSHMKTNTLQSTSDSTEIILEEQMYKHSLTNIDEINLAKDYYKRYNRCGVSFNLGFIYDGGTHDARWGYIKNHFYRKVNEFNAASVTKLSTSTDKLPLYPLIGEVAIDKKDIHVFKSSWDKNYYTRSLSGGNIEQVPGTFETKEEKSYLASTIMKVKDSYNLLNFTSEYVGSEEEQDVILLDNTNTSDLVIFENKDRIVIDFYITDTIKDKLSSDGVFNAIQQYVEVADSAEDKTTLVDDAQLYIEENLVNLFSLNQIKLFTRRIKGQFSAFENAATIDALDDGGYTQDQNFTFRAHEQKPLNFRLIYNKRLGYSYRIRPMIKITS